jgi:hypothetical protein
MLAGGVHIDQVDVDDLQQGFVRDERAIVGPVVRPLDPTAERLTGQGRP